MYADPIIMESKNQQQSGGADDYVGQREVYSDD